VHHDAVASGPETIRRVFLTSPQIAVFVALTVISTFSAIALTSLVKEYLGATGIKWLLVTAATAAAVSVYAAFRLSGLLRSRLAELDQAHKREADKQRVIDLIGEACRAIAQGELQPPQLELDGISDQCVLEEFRQALAGFRLAMEEVDGLFARMSEGQLAVGFEHSGGGRYASAASASRRGLGTISDAFTTIVRAANQIATSTVALTQDAKTLAETAQLQTDGLRTTATDADELKQIADQNAISAERAGILVGEAKKAAQAAIAVSNRLGDAVSELEATSKSVAAFTVLINDIATRTNLLALNASVEAARAGDSGNGFRVVAEEVRALAVKSAAASKDVSATIKQSGDRIRTGVGLAGEMRAVLEMIVKSVDSVSGQLEQIGIASSNQLSRVSDVTQSVNDLSHATLGYSSLVERTTNSIQGIDGQVSALANQVACITTFADWPHVTRVIEGGLAVSDAFEAAINQGRIDLEDCFDEHYMLIKGSNPEQYMTKFVELADVILPPIQEPILKSDASVFFCVAIDRNGFIPTHNLKYCQPSGPDIVWNAANCRNRRLLHDAVRMAAAKNKKPYLLQCYRRDMGGGNVVLMKSAAAPITIRGRHWGGLSMGYAVSDSGNR